jgi:CRISPR system Cascade subunit CasA
VTGLDEAPEGLEDWLERRDDVLQEGRLKQGPIDEYFTRCHDRFFLFATGEGGRPWLQNPRLAVQCDPGNTAGVNKLMVTRPSGNNHSW